MGIKQQSVVLLFCFVFMLVLGLCINPAMATDLPQPVLDYINNTFPDAKIRFDGVVELDDGTMYLPVLPVALTDSEEAVKVDLVIPEHSNRPDLVVMSNNYALMKVLHERGGKKTLLSGANVPLSVKLGLLPQDLIVPEGFVLPPDLEPIAGDLVIKKSINKVSGISSGSSDQYTNLEDQPIQTASGSTDSNVDIQPLKPVDDFQPVDRLPGLSNDLYFDFGNSFLYVLNITGDKIFTVDPKLSKVVESIKVASLPYDAVISADGNVLYVACMAANSLVSVNLKTKQMENIIKVGLRPMSLAISPDGGKLFVANNASGTVSVVNLELFEVTSNIEVQGMPDGIISSVDNHSFFLYDKANGIVSRWDYLNPANRQFLFVLKNPSALAIDSQENRLFVTSRTQNNLMIYNLRERRYETVVNVGDKPVDVDISPDGANVYVLNAGDDNITVIDGNDYKIKSTIELMSGGFPSTLVLIPGTNKGLVTNSQTDKITLVDLENGNILNMITIGMTSRTVVVSKEQMEEHQSPTAP